jgi:hypothetical protein
MINFEGSKTNHVLGYLLPLLALIGGTASADDVRLSLGEQFAAEFDTLSWMTTGDAWTKHHSVNFQVVAQGADITEVKQLAAVGEACLTILRSTWQPDVARLDWSPKCVLVIHRSPEGYDKAVGRSGSASWGSATVTRRRGKIADRRIDICAPTLRRLAETLPHELTHVLLADVFAGETVPRWLDEGAAVLAESATTIAERASAHALQSGEGPVFRSAELLHADSYPAGARRELFYAESHHLTCLLLEQGDAARLTAFAKSAGSIGYDAALREHYGLRGMAQLDQLRQQEIEKAGLVAQASRERNDGIDRVTLSSERRTGRFLPASYHGATPVRRERGN